MARPRTGPRAKPRASTPPTELPRTRIRATPRKKQSRPTVSFRTERVVLERLDYLAKRFDVTRNTVMEVVLKTYLVERGDTVEAMLAQIEADDGQSVLDIFA